MEGPYVDTPAGKRRLPEALEALLRVAWSRELEIVTDDDLRSEVQFYAFSGLEHCINPSIEKAEIAGKQEPQLRRAWYPFGYNDLQHDFVVDLDEPAAKDPIVYEFVHALDLPAYHAPSGLPLSSFLARLQILPRRRSNPPG